MSPKGVDMKSEDQSESGKKPTVLNLIASVLSAAFGIQSSKNHQRDIKYGKASTFIIAGIIYVVLFIIVVASLVHLVLKSKGL
jgi:hypothetical protein